LINYTGSLGFEQKAVEELRGKCGDLDVRECEEVIDRWVEAWEKQGWKGGWEGKMYVAFFFFFCSRFSVIRSVRMQS
jgi:hypothetical protein